MSLHKTYPILSNTRKKKNMTKEKTPKVKGPKHYTRAQAERALNNGTDPATFLDMSDPFKRQDPKNPGNTRNHNNYHVRQKAWKKLGMPIFAPHKEDQDKNKEEHAKFLKSIHIKLTEN